MSVSALKLACDDIASEFQNEFHHTPDGTMDCASGSKKGCCKPVTRRPQDRPFGRAYPEREDLADRGRELVV